MANWRDVLKEEEKENVVTGRVTNLRGRRTAIEKSQYDAMNRVERQKLAVEKLQSDEFEKVLRRYYEGGITDKNNVVTGGKNIKDFTKKELIEKFYQDRIWSEYNTAGIALDVGLVLGKDDEYKKDWAEITQVYADLPWFGSQTIGFTKWAKDFVPALVADPLNLFTFGTGSTIVREAAKTPLKGLAKKEFQKSAAKAAAWDVAKKEAAYGAAIGAGADMARQTAEIDADLMSDYNITRTLLAGTIGGAAQGTVGAGMGYWTGKRKAGKFYDKGDGFKGDYDLDYGVATPVNTKIKEPKKVTIKKTQKPAIEKKIKEIKRKTPIINLDRISSDESLTPAVKEIVKIVKRLKDEKKVRVNQRVGLFDQIVEKGSAMVKDKKARIKLQNELKNLAEKAPEFAPKIYAGRINIINKSQEIVEIKKIMNEAVDVDEKLAVANELEKSLNENALLVQNHIKTVEAVSDALNQQKIVVGLTEADKLRFEVDSIMSKDLPKILAETKKMTPAKKIKTIENLAELTGNDEAMRKVIRKVNRKTKDKKVTVFEALNEYTTANLLGDPTTHEVNVLSTIIKFNGFVAENYIMGLQSLKRGERQLAVDQIRMANDLLVSQFRFYQIAFKKAQLAWKANRSVGDTLEHRFDGKQQRNMETFFKQLQESDSSIKQGIAFIGSPIGKLSFLTLRALGAGDSFTKNIFNRAARVANVNQRMRKFYPELWKQNTKVNKRNIVKLQDKIISVKENIRFEKAQDKINVKKLDKLNKLLTDLESQKGKQTTFEKKWSEMYYQYEDEFGNFRPTSQFNSLEVKSLDDLTKSVAYDPTFVSQVNSFTQNLRSPLLDANQFFPDQKQSAGNIGQLVLDLANKYPLMRVFTGLHFVKTPMSLFKTAWQMTPVLNKYNLEFKGMLNASDPIVRQKAEAIQNLGRIVYGLAILSAWSGKVTGFKEKDRKHRFSYKYEDENGETKYVSLNRMYPFSLPFVFAAAAKDAMEEMADIFNDDANRAIQNKVTDFFQHALGSSFAIWSNMFASQLMTQDFFEFMAIFSEPEASTEEGAKNVSKIEKQASRTVSKIIPLATTWRWTNKVFGDAETELNTMLDHITQSSPFELLKIIDEKYLNNSLPPTLNGDALSPRRDPLKNIYPKPKGILLGNLQDILPVTNHWSSSIVDRFGKKIELNYKAKLSLSNTNLQWERPSFRIALGFGNSFNMKEHYVENITWKKDMFHDIENNKQLKLPEGTTLYEATNIVASQIILGGKTLNERFADELNNPESRYNKRYYNNERFAGKYEGDQYLLEIIREYELEARNYVKEFAVFKADGQDTTIFKLEEKLGNMELERELNILKQ